MIKRTRISPEGPELSQLVYGTWRILDDASTANTAHLLRCLHQCLDLGITSLDTAEIYGLYRVEEALGAAFQAEPGLRDKFEIVTKCGIYVPCDFHPERRVAFYNAESARITKSVDKSLRLMRIDHIDVLLVHRPDWLTSADETAAGLNAVIGSGKVKHAGVSNYSAHQYELLSSRVAQPLVTNQLEMNLLAMDALYDGTLAQAERLRTKPMAWSPLAGGRLLDASNPATQRLQQLTERLSAKYDGASLDQLSYAWIMAHPSQPLPVIGTSKPERIVHTAKSASIRLEREDWYALWTAAKGHGIP